MPEPSRPPSDPVGGEPAGGPHPGQRTPDERAGRLLAQSLRIVYIPVVILLLAALGAFVYGTIVFAHSVRQIVDRPIPVGHQIGLFFLDVDLFLIGATLLISAIGLYELFIGRVHSARDARIPAWIEMSDLNDLKGRIIVMIVLVLSVAFVEVVVDSPSGGRALDLGGGIAAVVVALSIFMRLGSHGS
ncbi:MAG: YqhA family protein [Acidimicrobiales bacterium]